MTKLATLLDNPGHNSGSKRVRCPKCRKYIFVPIYTTDYIHHNCYTRDKFAMDKLTSDAWNLVALKGTFPMPRGLKDQTINKDQDDDASFEIGKSETKP